MLINSSQLAHRSLSRACWTGSSSRRTNVQSKRRGTVLYERSRSANYFLCFSNLQGSLLAPMTDQVPRALTIRRSGWKIRLAIDFAPKLSEPQIRPKRCHCALGPVVVCD
ncbi:hypothetical protein CPSG_09782 [Coccidioides posadasii str. Silveira]|uniref:Uncharacterized protein n=1 Tax=Coccidioides posadasii (strain RMSCC 757 / Silveira) TaxID=443226 RepID=E9DIY3_COCPS|nr:hypothetical protein CPSG_09782 [Coccidioides posadasii str. Silveira]